MNQLNRIALVAMALFVFSACSNERARVAPGVLTISKEQQASWVRNFNPLLASELTRYPTTGGIYEPMLIFNVLKGKYLPWLATDYRWSDDSRRLTFTVRGGVNWSDGAPFTARDVAFTFNLLRRHRAVDLQGVWGFLSEVRATDDHTVVFNFARPYTPGLLFIAHQSIVPEHIWKDVSDPVMFTNDNPVATGPFTEVLLFQNQVYELGRNPNYWQPGKPKVERLRFPAYPSNDQANLALIHGEIDWAGTFVPAIDRIFVGRDPEHHGYWFPLVGGTVMLYTNSTRAPLSDVRVRKALSMAIKREQVVEVAMYGYTQPARATGLCDAYGRWHDEEAIRKGKWVNYDPAAAERMLEEVGLKRRPDGKRVGPDGEVVKLELNTVTGWSDWVRAAQIIVRSLRKLGIDASLNTYDFSAWFDKLQRGDFDLSMGWTVEGATPYTFYRNLMSKRMVKPIGETSSSNWHRFGSERADELLTEFESTTQFEQQHAISRKLQAIFVEQAPVIPLFYAPTWGEYNSTRFTGFPTAENPYARLTPSSPPESLLVLTALTPR